ncbi:MAG: DUF5615 family PIN-like protein [Candidatus Acidiferrum sp.]
MKIKLDENLPASLTSLIESRGHEVYSICEEGLIGHTDVEVWSAAQRESRFLITQDLDFPDLRRFFPGTHHGILLVRLRTPNRENLALRVAEIFRTEDVESWVGCFVVATERKIRLLKPPHKQNS